MGMETIDTDDTDLVPSMTDEEIAAILGDLDKTLFAVVGLSRIAEIRATGFDPAGMPETD